MNLVKTPFLNLTLLTFCVAGILWLICRAIYPLRDIAENTQGYLIPALIVILCIELYLIKDYTSKILINTSKNFTFKSFKSGAEFDDYLKHRLNEVQSVKIVHISSYASDNLSVNGIQREYSTIIGKYIDSGKLFHRIFCNSNNPEIFAWIRSDMTKYQSKKFSIGLLENVNVNDIRISGIMLLDDKEVCLGGGYQSTITSPTIAIQNPEIVSFFRENFITYCQKSKCICNEGVIDWSTFIEHEKRALSLKDVSPSANSTTLTG